MTHYQRRKTHEKETTKGTADPCRHTAYIFYSSALPFFHSICRNQIHLSCNRRTAERNLELFSELLLIITILFGRHFCGYACAFGSLGDALYELTAFIRAKCFGKKKKHGYPEEWVHRLQKVKYVILAFLLLSCITGFYSKLQGMSPWDVFSMLTTGRLPKSTYIVGTVLLILIMVGMCTQERFFCQFLCPMGAVFAIMPIIPGALFKRNRPNCAPKCTLCKKRCPAHLDIDGDTAHSGECICCHACTAVCPRKNIYTGTVIDKN